MLIIGIVLSAVLAASAIYNFYAFAELGDEWKPILEQVGRVLGPITSDPEGKQGWQIYPALMAFSIAEALFAIVNFVGCCPCMRKKKPVKIVKGVLGAITLAFFIWYLVMHYTLYNGVPSNITAFCEESKSGFVCIDPYISWDACKIVVDSGINKGLYYMYGATALAEALFYVGIILAVAAGIFLLVYACVCK